MLQLSLFISLLMVFVNGNELAYCFMEVNKQDVLKARVERKDDGFLYATVWLTEKMGNCSEIMHLEAYFNNKEYDVRGTQIMDLTETFDNHSDYVAVIKFSDQMIYDEAETKIARKESYQEYNQYSVSVQLQFVKSDVSERYKFVNLEVVIFDYLDVTVKSQQSTFKEEELCPEICCESKMCQMSNNYHVAYDFIDGPDVSNAVSREDLTYLYQEQVFLKLSIRADSFESGKPTSLLNEAAGQTDDGSGDGTEGTDSSEGTDESTASGVDQTTEEEHAKVYSWNDAQRHLSLFEVQYAENKNNNNIISKIHSDGITLTRTTVVDENDLETVIGEDLLLTFLHESVDSKPGQYLAFTMVCAELNGLCYDVDNEDHVLESNGHATALNSALSLRVLQASSEGDTKFAMNSYVSQKTKEPSTVEKVTNTNRTRGQVGIVVIASVLVIGVLCVVAKAMRAIEETKSTKAAMYQEPNTQQQGNQQGDVEQQNQTDQPVDGQVNSNAESQENLKGYDDQCSPSKNFNKQFTKFDKPNQNDADNGFLANVE